MNGTHQCDSNNFCLRLHEPVWSALVTRLRGRPQGWEGWPRAVSQVEDSLQRRVAGGPDRGCGPGLAKRHSLSHGHGQEAPPTPRSPAARAPPHSSLRTETPILRIGVRLALGLALSCERGYEATERAPGGGRAIDHEVEPTFRPGAVVRASICCSTTWPSGPTASRATRTQARSSPFARRARRPVRGHASEWSPNSSVRRPQPCAPPSPQRSGAKGNGRRNRRRSAICMVAGCSVNAGSLGTAVSQAPACGPDCERSNAWRLGAKAGSSTQSRY